MTNLQPIRSISRQRGVSALLIVGSLLIVAGLAGIGFVWMQPGSPPPGVATAESANRAAAPMPQVAQQASPEQAPPPVIAKPTPTSGPHPNWHGTWQGTTPDSKMVISAAGVEIFDVYENDGKKNKSHQMTTWGNATEATGNGEESGYAKSSVSLAEISRDYEATVARFRRDPSDLSISDPTQSRRMIGRINPGNYRVVWADLGGDCGQSDMIIDGDLILSIVNCRYRHEISLFTRQGATPSAIGQEPQGTARVMVPPSLPGGRWQGTVTQAGYSPYPAVMHLQSSSAGTLGGTMAYPSIPCTASLTFIRSEGNAFWFRESIQEGRGKCLDGGQISVLAVPGDTVVWRYFMAGNLNSPVATGTFRR